MKQSFIIIYLEPTAKIKLVIGFCIRIFKGTLIQKVIPKNLESTEIMEVFYFHYSHRIQKTQ